MVLFRWIFGLLQLLILLLVLALIFPNHAARILLSGGLRLALGAPVHVREARVDLFGTAVHFRDVEIRNPYELPPGEILKIPHLFLDLEAGALLNRQVRLESVEVEVEQMEVLRDPRGRVNLLALKTFKPVRLPLPPPVPVNRFVLTLRKGAFRDQQGGTSYRKFDLDMIKAEYLNVSRLREMVDILSWEALRRMRLEGLAGGLLDRVQEDLGTPNPEPVRRSSFF